MNCHGCGKEYNSDSTVCPDCGRTLVDGPALTGGTAEPPASEPVLDRDLGSTLAVSGERSIRSRLRPRSVGEILQESCSLYARHWKLLWGIVLAYGIPLALLQIALDRCASSGVTLSYRSTWIENLVYLVTQFCLVRTVSEIYLLHPMRPREAVKLNFRFLNFIGSGFLSGVYILGACLVTVFPALLLAREYVPGRWTVPLGVTGLVVLVGAGLVAIAWSGVAGAAAVVEGTGARGSLRRSFDLMRGFFRKGLGLMLAAALLYFLTWVFTAAVVNLFAGLFFPGIASATVPEPLSTTVIRHLCELLAMVVALPLMHLPLVLFYYDLRVRKEAFDLQMLAEQLGYGAQTIVR